MEIGIVYLGDPSAVYRMSAEEQARVFAWWRVRTTPPPPARRGRRSDDGNTFSTAEARAWWEGA